MPKKKRKLGPRGGGLYETVSFNLESKVVEKLRANSRANRRQFRSVSALANYLLARSLGLSL